jgi:hypothetical protein
MHTKTCLVHLSYVILFQCSFAIGRSHTCTCTCKIDLSVCVLWIQMGRDLDLEKATEE